MINDELLDILKEEVVSFPMARMSNALIATIKLHAPFTDNIWETTEEKYIEINGRKLVKYGERCAECFQEYPCQTIISIQEALK